MKRIPPLSLQRWRASAVSLAADGQKVGNGTMSLSSNQTGWTHSFCRLRTSGTVEGARLEKFEVPDLDSDLHREVTHAKALILRTRSSRLLLWHSLASFAQSIRAFACKCVYLEMLELPSVIVQLPPLVLDLRLFLPLLLHRDRRDRVSPQL